MSTVLRETAAAYDVEAIRRDFPILATKVYDYLPLGREPKPNQSARKRRFSSRLDQKFCGKWRE